MTQLQYSLKSGGKMLGERYIGCGSAFAEELELVGTPGNALGALS